MFWGLIMEPNKRYSQLVERSFHLSMASLDVTGANDQPVQVMLCYENRNYLLCTLKKGTIFQVPLDLNFQEGTKIAFTCNGFGHVHLTGYLTLDEDLDFGDLEEDEEEEEAPQLVKPKRKAVESPPTKASKKLKKQVNDDDEDSSEDDDLDMDAESDSDEEDQTKLVAADDDEDESEDESDDEEEDEDDDSEDEPEPEQEVAKSNKQKQKQQNQQQAQNQNNQAGKKQEKQKMVNGKDSSKLDLSKQKKNKSEQQQLNNSQQGKKRIVEGGVVVEDLVVGNGAPAKNGKAVSVYYVGRLKNGKKFDETRQGDGFKFQLGKGEVIKGWDVGISGMKIGGKRRLTIPAPMGYGNKGSPPVIPGNSTLIFEVELKKVH